MEGVPVRKMRPLPIRSAPHMSIKIPATMSIRLISPLSLSTPSGNDSAFLPTSRSLLTCAMPPAAVPPACVTSAWNAGATACTLLEMPEKAGWTERAAVWPMPRALAEMPETPALREAPAADVECDIRSPAWGANARILAETTATIAAARIAVRRPNVVRTAATPAKAAASLAPASLPTARARSASSEPAELPDSARGSAPNKISDPVPPSGAITDCGTVSVSAGVSANA